MGIELRPLSFGEVLDGTFKIFQTHLRLFLSIALAFEGPVTLITAWQRIAQQGMPPGKLPHGFAALVVPTMAASFLGWGTIAAATVQVVMEDRPPTLGAASKRFVGVLAPAVGASLWALLIGGLCMLAVMIPGVIYLLHRGLFLPVLLVEGGSGRNALERSKTLVRGIRRRGETKQRAEGRLARMFGVTAVFSILRWALMLGTGLVIPASVKTTFIGLVLGLVPQMMLAPLLPIAVVLIYFDARVRDEGYPPARRTAGATVAVDPGPPEPSGAAV